MLPPPPTPASERSTRPRPSTQRAEPPSCHREYLVPMKKYVRTIAHTMVQQSNSVTLVIEENWKALLTAEKAKGMALLSR